MFTCSLCNKKYKNSERTILYTSKETLKQLSEEYNTDLINKPSQFCLKCGIKLVGLDGEANMKINTVEKLEKELNAWLSGDIYDLSDPIAEVPMSIIKEFMQKIQEDMYLHVLKSRKQELERLIRHLEPEEICNENQKTL